MSGKGRCQSERIVLSDHKDGPLTSVVRGKWVTLRERVNPRKPSGVHAASRRVTRPALLVGLVVDGTLYPAVKESVSKL